MRPQLKDVAQKALDQIQSLEDPTSMSYQDHIAGAHITETYSQYMGVNPSISDIKKWAKSILKEENNIMYLFVEHPADGAGPVFSNLSELKEAMIDAIDRGCDVDKFEVYKCTPMNLTVDLEPRISIEE
jgi:hypothetical protein